MGKAGPPLAALYSSVCHSSDLQLWDLLSPRGLLAAGIQTALLPFTQLLWGPALLIPALTNICTFAASQMWLGNVTTRAVARGTRSCCSPGLAADTPKWPKAQHPSPHCKVWRPSTAQVVFITSRRILELPAGVTTQILMILTALSAAYRELPLCSISQGLLCRCWLSQFGCSGSTEQPGRLTVASYIPTCS